MKNTTKKNRYNLTINPDVRKQGASKAAKEGRSFSNYVEQLIIKDNETNPNS